MDRIVVITGGTSGIGRELADMFRKNNDTVVVLANAGCDDSGMEYTCDVSNEKQVQDIFSDIQKRFGRVDILLNNAGYGMSGITELIPTEKSKAIFDVDFFGVVNCTKYALPMMGKGAKIVNTGSAMAFFPVPYRAYYAAVKSAVVTMTYSQRSELKPLGIDLCTICPGDIKTNFTKSRVKEFETNDRYGDAIERATKKVDGREDKRMSAEVCAKRMYKIINKKRMKPMYIIGGFHKFLHFVARFVPTKWLLWGINKVCG
ncbi:MAG: SDR family NAD(P)-dependent oxidoreductase [Clostridiales bacterium]|nr:SDR family NAD(P)-dependent oxidoreductase [Clostridiales bacterium]